MNRRRTWILASIALIALLVGNWWLSRSQEATGDEDGRVAAPFDYALTDYEAVLFDADGNESLRVAGPRLEHDPESRTALLQDPRFTLPGERADWQGRADRGRLSRDDETLLLEGRVELVQPQPRGPLRVTTERLAFERPAGVLRSDRPTRITQAGTELVGGTLTYLLNDDRVELQDDVHAIYRDPADARAGRSDAADPGAGRR